ncbi:MAG TPA: hypothetical protein VFR97_11235 [Capillimicrobium sp.]|nr:hypothetical protein [Capillimicrobium sp.]
MSVFAAAAEAAPAGGAALDQVAIATGAATLVTLAMLFMAVGHRTGRVRWIGRLAAFGERVSGLPGWAVVPSTIVGISLLTALFGMYWDISLHIDRGRDEGPLANPAHYFILAGLFGVLFAAVAACALPLQRTGPSAVKIAPGWYAPVGGVLMFFCAAFALTGFPLDDVWHRLFGQDVTLWGPTHLMLIGGASLAVIATLVLQTEAHAARPTGPRSAVQRRMQWLRTGLLAGGLLLALSTFQAEFDFGVPQFRLMFHPLLLMLAAGVGLVVARIHMGRGGALLAVASFVVIRGVLALIIGPVLGESTPHFPLYLVEALCVEAVAWRLGTDRPLRLGAISGVLIGTLGLAAEWAWSALWMPLEWPTELMGEALVVSLVVAIAAGTLGGWIGAAVTPSVPRPRHAGRFAAVAFAVLLASIAFTLPTDNDTTLRASVELTDVHGPAGEREVDAVVRLDPADAADGALWFTSTSWQGGGSVIEPLREVSPGVWRTTEPIPVDGTWKTLLRLHDGRSLLGLPVYLPEDAAIPAPAVEAPSRFERSFTSDRLILQREQKQGVAGWLTLVAYLTVLAIALAMAAGLGWGLARLGRRTVEGDGGDRFDRGRRAPVTAPPRPAATA